MNNDVTKEKLLTAAAVGQILSLSKRQIFRMRAGAAIPAPIRVGAGTIRWRMSDILLFLECDADMAKFRGRKAAEIC